MSRPLIEEKNDPEKIQTGVEEQSAAAGVKNPL